MNESYHKMPVFCHITNTACTFLMTLVISIVGVEGRGEHFPSFHSKLDSLIDVTIIAPDANRVIPAMESALFNKINDTTLMI